MAEKGKCRFSLFITFNVRDILLAILCVCEFQSICSFTVKPRESNSVTRSIMVLFIIRRGISFSAKTVWRWWNIMILFFCTLSDSLFKANLFNSELNRILTLSRSPSQPLDNEHIVLLSIVSSAYKMTFKLSLTVCISFIYMINRSGPKIQPWGTPVSSSLIEDVVPLKSTYWVRLDK